jgi:hypothetical protein
MEYNKYKYNKYCKKINNLNLEGGKYQCIPKNKFKNICLEDDNGKYKSKESCINDCEKNYIKEQLIEANLNKETKKFYKFINHIITNENIKVYVKGGNVIGLKILKMIYDKYKNDQNKFKKYFDEFLKLNLIKDWDFASYTNKEITNEYKDHLNNIAKEHHLVPRAKTYILYQTKHPIMTHDGALFEISILGNEHIMYSNMEIPLTTMKVRVNKYNINYIFMFAKAFLDYQNDKEFDFDILKRMISKISVIINPCKNGFYNDSEKFDNGGFNKDLLKFIKKYEKYDKNLPQFLITHLKTPFRLLYRLPEKNIPKSKKIKIFLNNIFPNKKFNWLFKSDFVSKIINIFTKDFGNKLVELYKNEGLDGIIKFIDGIEQWNRIEIEYDKLFTDKNKELLNNMVGELKNKIGKGIQELDETNKFFHLLQKIE